ncbi:uncharacterized protein LOC119281500 [Triticum dicoccoides]|uniref:uncharacterized protein LOC119281500 n=1 Tax=Triticum dicoccoides TaxID=85692 RepID=UPI00188F50E5|nr:uncharacterized protein LOC119281500 [Triticum dicoccoides]
MALLARCLLLCLALVVLSMGSLPSKSSAMGLPRPPPNVNFTIGVEGAVWCKGCRYAGYVKSKNASPIPNAPALLRCKRGQWALSMWGATDARGYFQIQTAQQSAPFTSKDCKVYVLGSPVRVRRARQAPREQGVAAQVPQVRDAARRDAGALHGRRLHLRAQEARKMLIGPSSLSFTGSGTHAVSRRVGVLLMFYTVQHYFKNSPLYFPKHKLA